MAGRKRNSYGNTFQQLMRLGPKKAIIILILAGLAYFFEGGSFLQDRQERINEITSTGSQDFVSGVVTRVVDGDTMVVKVDGQERRVRMLGVDTPETVHPNKPVQFYGKEASRFTKDSLTGRRVWLEYDASPQDRYNRHLAYVWLANPNVINEESMRQSMFNAKLLLGGYAKVMIIRPNKRYENEFRKFQNEAEQKNLGVWSQ